MTVKNPSIKLNQTEATLAVNETVKLTATTAPKSAASSVTYTTSDEKVATVANDGTVKAVAAGEATITASAKCGSKTVTATAKVTVKKVALKNVSQTKLNELTAEIVGETKGLVPTDFTLVNTESKVVYPVSKVTVDSKDATKVTLELLSNLDDGKNYEITLDGVTLPLKASDGKVASIALNKITIPYATPTEIKLVAKDANGVIVKELAYGTFDASYDFTIDTNGNGSTDGSKLTLNKVGDTAVAEITYKSGKYDATGKPEGNIGPNKVTITAVDQVAVNNFDVRIGKSTDKKFDKVKENKRIAINEPGFAFFQIKDADGNEISPNEYSKYSVKSSDEGVLMLSGSDIDTANGNRIELVASKAGTAYLLIEKDGKLVSSIAITVVAERYVAGMTVDPKTVTLTNSPTVGQTATVKASFVDQYGDAITGAAGDVTVTCTGAPSGVKADDVTNNTGKTYYVAPAQDNDKVKVVFNGSGLTKGSYTYKFVYKKDGHEAGQTVTVTVNEPGNAGSTLTFGMYTEKNLSETIVTKLDEDTDFAALSGTPDTFTLSVGEKLNGEFASKDLNVADKVQDNSNSAKQSTIKAIDYKITRTKDGKTETVIDTAASPSVTTCPGITVGADKKITVDVVKQDSVDTTLFNRLADGTYRVYATVQTLPAGKADNTDNYVKKEASASFTVKDETPAITDAKIANSTAAAGSCINDLVANALKFSYSGKTYSKNDEEAVQVVYVWGTTNGATTKIDDKNSASATLAVGKRINVTKVVVKVKVGDTGKYILQTLNVSGGITAE